MNKKNLAESFENIYKYINEQMKFITQSIQDTNDSLRIVMKVKKIHTDIKEPPEIKDPYGKIMDETLSHIQVSGTNKYYVISKSYRLRFEFDCGELKLALCRHEDNLRRNAERKDFNIWLGKYSETSICDLFVDPNNDDEENIEIVGFGNNYHYFSETGIFTGRSSGDRIGLIFSRKQ